MCNTAILLALSIGVLQSPVTNAPARQKSDLEQSVESYLSSAAKERRFSGVVLVAKDGKSLFRRAYGFADWTKRTPNEPDTRFMIFSVTKQFTAALILRLAEEGKLSVSDPVSKHVGDWPKEWESVTVHHLLTHSSGIEVDTQYFWLIKHHPEYWEDPARKPPPYEPKNLLNEPGTTFRYSNAGYTVLTLIAANAGGKPFPKLMEETVFRPLGMAHTGLEGISPALPRARGHRLTAESADILEQKTHYIVGAGDMVTTVDDLLKWDESLYGEKFLSERSRKAMFTPFVKGKRGGFGYGWLIRDTTDKRPMHVFSGSGSGFTAYVIRRPDIHLYVAVLTNQETEGEFQFGTGVLDLAERSLQSTAGEPGR
jgi:CubicO group peptidase (beta-lactamase class C family)